MFGWMPCQLFKRVGLSQRDATGLPIFVSSLHVIGKDITRFHAVYCPLFDGDGFTFETSIRARL